MRLQSSGSIAADPVQGLIPSVPHSLLPGPVPLPIRWGEGVRRPGEGISGLQFNVPISFRNHRCFRRITLTFAFCFSLSLFAQTPDNPPRRDGDRPPAGERPPREGRPGLDGPPPFGPGGPGPGGMGGVQEEVKLVKQFDKDGDKRLNAEERKAAREFLEKEKAEGRGRRGPGFRGRNENQEPPQPGPKLSPADVKSFSDAPLYDMQTLRTLFLEFENGDWEKEVADFYNTDVEVPAKLTVDGKTYRDVGVHFRGASSFFTVGAGRKRSLNVSLDFAHEDQQLGGYRTLNLLNSHTDPTFLRTILYYQIAREYVPAPKANYVRVVINGESWGVYVSAQQFNKDLVKDWFGTAKGVRWKVPGSPRGRGGLNYIGEDVRDYKRIYDIKTKDDQKSWADLIRLCKVLNETPAEQLEKALEPLLDLDGVLKFLALENALINSDGYWIRSSDYNLYQDEKGRFHIIPHDANETFRAPEGPGMGRGGGGGGGAPNTRGVELDPFAGADDPNKPLLNKLLAVPSLRTRYLGYIRDIAEKWLDWNKLAPMAQQYQAVIAADVKTDTRKLYPLDAFAKGITEDVEEQGFRGPRRNMSLKSFVEQRRTFLLNHPEVKKAGR
jgi:CotH protein